MTSINAQRTERALRRLKEIKPVDGWTTDPYVNSAGEKLVMLKRRNIHLAKKGFECIAYDEQTSKCIIGVTSTIGDTGKSTFCRGVVLVEKDGSVARDQREVRFSLKKGQEKEGYVSNKENEFNNIRKEVEKGTRQALQFLDDMAAGTADKNTRTPRANSGARAGTASTNMAEGQISDETKKMLAYAICALLCLRILSSLFKVLVYSIALPLGILFLMQNCPSNESFDAKKELKRVLRGHHLPDSHPEKPKDDWLSQGLARITASVTTELATSLGYELSFFNVFGACSLVTVQVPSIRMELYWFGACGSWYYLYQREVVPPAPHN